MDLITQTSLEALLLKATSSSNQNIDTAAVEAFCTLVNKEKDGAFIGAKVIANRLHSGVEKEVLQTLNVLDSCMGRCGTHFQAEIGKFRFLNEMIKLVSPKYLGSQTPTVVKQKVLQLLYVWTLDFPKETKIKEAYDMLRKQGVIREIPNPNITNDPKKRPNSIFHDEEKSKILQKLLQSKDPEDIQAANWLIKSMVKEDEKRVELRSRRVSELESTQNNIKLLNEMLDSYISETTSQDEKDLIRELYESCERLRPNLAKLASETPQNEEILGDILQINDELTSVFSKYKEIMNGESGTEINDNINKDLSLLNFEIGNSSQNLPKNVQNGAASNVDVLCDLFNNSEIASAEVLTPVQLKTHETTTKTENKFKALDDLDILGAHLMKQDFNFDSSKTSFNNKSQDKVPMNLLTKKNEPKATPYQFPKNQSNPSDFNLTVLIEKSPPKIPDKSSAGDESLMDISDDKMLDTEEMILNHRENPKTEFSLKDITVELKDIRPSSLSPVTILSKNEVDVTLHYAKDRTKEDVRVFVVTTVSKNQFPLSGYLFQAVVPRCCKLKLQPPSATELPVYNSFLPPSAITQIMLIFNPDQVEINLKFVLSYMMDDETITEMGETLIQNS